MPGLVNAHCHAAMTLFRGLADDLELMAWLNRTYFPGRGKACQPGDGLLVLQACCCGNAAFRAQPWLPTATFLKMKPPGHSVRPVYGRLPRRESLIFRRRECRIPPRMSGPPPGFSMQWQGRDPLVTPAVFAHAPYTCSAATLQRAKEEASREGSAAVHPCGGNPGGTGHDPGCRAAVRRSGILMRWVSLMNRRSASTVSGSMRRIWISWPAAGQGSRLSAVPPEAGLRAWHRFRECWTKSVVVGLGTDGAASNNSLDMFREMDICAKVQKVRTLDPVGSGLKTFCRWPPATERVLTVWHGQSGFPCGGRSGRFDYR